MSQNIVGANPSASSGVTAINPPDMWSRGRDPLPRDQAPYQVNDFWRNTKNYNLWYLGSKIAGLSKWILVAGGAGDVNSIVTDLGTAMPNNGILFVIANGGTDNCGSTVDFSGAGDVVLLNVTDANNNTIIGKSAGNAAIAAVNNTTVGYEALNMLSTGNSNTVVGNQSAIKINTGQANTLVGNGVGTVITTGSFNTGIGTNVFSPTFLAGLTTGSYNVAIGDISASNYTSVESSNILLSNTGTVGESNVIHLGTNGNGNGQQNTTYLHGGNVHVTNGNLYLDQSTTTAGTNPFIYFGSGSNYISFFLNSFFAGQNAGLNMGAGIFNIGIGPQALRNYTTGSQNTAIGNGALQLVNTGNANTAIGYVSGTAITTGAQNVLLGDGTGSNYTGAESGNTIIGYGIGGTVGESNCVRLGNPGTSTTCFIGGIRGITTGVNNAIAVLIDSNGQLGTVSSSERSKENIKDMSDYSSPLMSLRPVIFNYKKDSSQSISVGLIAEEVDKIMPDLVVYKDGEAETVKYLDLIPMLLNEIQKLAKKIKFLEDKLS